MASSTADSVAKRPAALRRSLLTPWPACVLALLVFASSLRNGFTYDDHALVVDNPRIEDATDWRAIWLSDWWFPREGTEFSPYRDRLYRPLTLQTFALNHALHNLAPAGYHAVNIVLHAAVCLLVWHLARRLSGSPATASIAAALFAVHPVHAEAVANVVGRAEVLATALLCAGLLAVLPPVGLPPWRRTLMAAPLFLAALLAKESAISYLPVVILLWLARGARHAWPRRAWLIHLSLLVVPLAVYFPLRYIALEQQLVRPVPGHGIMNPLVSATSAERCLGVFTVLGHYVRLLLVPARLSSDYSLAVVDPRAGIVPHTVLGIAAAAAWIIGLAGYLRPRGAWRMAAVLCATTLASYVLISNAIVLIGVSLAERLLYWPSVHALMLLSFGVVALWHRYCAAGGLLASRAGLLRVLGAAVLAALSLRTVFRSLDWADNLTLISQDLRTWPQSAHLNKGLALELLRLAARTDDPRVRHEYLVQADACLARALDIFPSHASTLGLRAATRAELGDRTVAVRYARGALLLNPHNDDALSVLARLESNAAQDNDALDALRAAANAQPDNAAAQLDAGRALFDAGQTARARPYLERAAQLRPDDVEALKLYGHVLALLRREGEALELLRRALAVRPNDWDIHANLSWLLARRGAVDEALRHAERARTLQPDDLRVQINLAEAYLLADRRTDALTLFRRILTHVDPAEPMHAIIARRIEEIESRR